MKRILCSFFFSPLLSIGNCWGGKIVVTLLRERERSLPFPFSHFSAQCVCVSSCRHITSDVNEKVAAFSVKAFTSFLYSQGRMYILDSHLASLFTWLNGSNNQIKPPKLTYHLNCVSLSFLQFFLLFLSLSFRFLSPSHLLLLATLSPFTGNNCICDCVTGSSISG